MHYIVVEFYLFYFYINSIAKLSRANLFFTEKMHTGSCAEGQSRRMGFREITSHVEVRTSCSLPRWSIIWHANMAPEVAVAVIPFKLEIWKTLGKPCSLINYCQVNDLTKYLKTKPSQALNKGDSFIFNNYYMIIFHNTKQT